MLKNLAQRQNPKKDAAVFRGGIPNANRNPLMPPANPYETPMMRPGQGNMAAGRMVGVPWMVNERRGQAKGRMGQYGGYGGGLFSGLMGRR
jgi:hypothetical protein